jgi:hypothetical protein
MVVVDRSADATEHRDDVLVGRVEERRLLDAAVEGIRDGMSSVLVVSGEAGIGKTALMDDVVGSVNGIRVVRTAGIEGEIELPHAALHRVLQPFLSRVGVSPHLRGRPSVRPVGSSRELCPTGF